MSSTTSESLGRRKTCYVLMPFGKKTDFETGRVLDMDATYREMIKPAVEEAGLDCVRADEIVNAGLIDMPMYGHLLNADLVVADISTLRPNVLYELGVRHALRPYSTIVIADEFVLKSAFFELNHLVIRGYRHLGEDIGVSEATRFRAQLTTAIKQIMTLGPEHRRDSPVYMFLDKLQPPALSGSTPIPAVEPTPIISRVTMRLAAIIAQFEEAVASGDGSAAAASINAANVLFEDGYDGEFALPPRGTVIELVLGALNWKGDKPYKVLFQARQMFEKLSPKDSMDSELLRLLGELELALYGTGGQTDRLERARQAFHKLYALRPEYDIASALANVVSLQTEHRTEKRELLFDVVYAYQLRREVVELGKSKLSKIDERYSPEGRLTKDVGKSASQQRAEALAAKLSVLAAIAEAYYGLGETNNYTSIMNEVALLPRADDVLKKMNVRVALLDSFVERQAALLSSVNHPQLVESESAPTARATKRLIDESVPRPSDDPKSLPARDLVFFSYSHNSEDEKLLEEIKILLNTANNAQNINLWHDKSGIKPGQEWEKEIKSALSKAKGAVLLVSREFLNSDFINNKELPAILEGAKEGKIALMWVAVEKAFFDRTLLHPFEALNDPKVPLSTFSGSQRDDEIFRICEKIVMRIFPTEI